jgi:geranylgeranyl diphosphate synthase, type II
MPTDFANVLQEYRSEIDPFVHQYLKTPIPGLIDENDTAHSFHWNLVSDYPNRGGKYLRPTLLTLATEALGGLRKDALLPAAAMEVCQNWALIHDDFEDDSILRRGDTALHRKYSPELAVNAGDVLQVIQWKMIRDTEHSLGLEKMLRLHDEFYRMLMRTALGQTEELRLNGNISGDLSEKDYLFLIDGKTGYYSIGGPLRLGAIVACDDMDLLYKTIFPAFSAFGLAFGRAFQIIDDVLDNESDFGGTKQQGGDIYEGKLTLIVLHAIAHAKAEDAVRLLKVLNKPRKETTDKDVSYAIQLMADLGSVDYARKQAQQYADQAKALLARMNFLTIQSVREKIVSGLEFVVNRTH